MYCKIVKVEVKYPLHTSVLSFILLSFTSVLSKLSMEVITNDFPHFNPILGGGVQNYPKS